MIVSSRAPESSSLHNSRRLFIELRRSQGMSLEEAVVDAGAVRFRPMLLTAAAVVGCERHPVGPGFPGDWLSRLWPAQWPNGAVPHGGPNLVLLVPEGRRSAETFAHRPFGARRWLRIQEVVVDDHRTLSKNDGPGLCARHARAGIPGLVRTGSCSPLFWA